MNDMPILLKKKGYESEHYKTCLNIGIKFVQQVFRNNTYLLKKANMTLTSQLKELKREGITISRSNVSKYKAGIKSCKLTFLIFFANYWNIPLPKLMNEDFETSDKINTM